MKVEFNNEIYVITDIHHFLTTIYYCKGEQSSELYDNQIKFLERNLRRKISRHFTFRNDSWFIWRGDRGLPTIKMYRG